MTLVPGDTLLPLLARRPERFFRTYWLPLALLAIGATADGVTTFANLSRFGAHCELHLVQRWLCSWAGVEWGVPLGKLLQFTFALFVSAWWRPWCGWLMSLCGVSYLAASLSNHFLLI